MESTHDTIAGQGCAAGPRTPKAALLAGPRTPKAALLAGSRTPKAALPMELLAPAGGPEQLECAVHFGADAVYLAGRRFGMRRKAGAFSDEDIARAVSYAHEHGVKVYATANTLVKDADLPALADFIAVLREARVDAAIVSDMGALSLCRRIAPELDIHLSTQASCMNAAAARTWHELGASRVVAAREMSLAEIAQMRAGAGDELEIEVFVHGAMCMAYSGRCLISDHLAGRERGANLGSCAQPCRWKYALVEETRPGEPLPVIEDGGGSFILSSSVMYMLAHLPELAAAGVDSVKIEGRAKGAYYVAATVNAYRHVLDGADAAAWQGELETTSHRPWSTGFFFGSPGQNRGVKEYTRAYQMVARVVGAPADAAGEGEAASVNKVAGKGADASTGQEGGAHVGEGGKPAAGEAEVVSGAAAGEGENSGRIYVACRNAFSEGGELEVLSPGREVFVIRPRELRWHAAPGFDPADIERRGEGAMLGPDPDVEGGTLCAARVANRTMERYSFVCDERLREGDILRARQVDR